jgi:hypothetical protein
MPLHEIICFYISPQEIPFFHKTLMHPSNADMYVQNNYGSFFIFWKYVFGVKGAYVHESQNEFPCIEIFSINLIELVWFANQLNINYFWNRGVINYVNHIFFNSKYWCKSRLMVIHVENNLAWSLCAWRPCSYHHQCPDMHRGSTSIHIDVLYPSMRSGLVLAGHRCSDRIPTTVLYQYICLYYQRGLPTLDPHAQLHDRDSVRLLKRRTLFR